MELRLLRKDDGFIELEASGEDPSIFDSLSEILQNMKGVEYAGMVIKHPLSREVVLRVKTNPNTIKAEEALLKAAQELVSLSKDILQNFQNL